MSKIILGIHGLANKPEKATLQNWWLEALNEGLEWKSYNNRVSPDQFKILYWADSMYVKSQSEAEEPESPFHLQQTYLKSNKAPQSSDEGVLDHLREMVSDRIDDVLDNWGFLDTIANALLSLKLKDLAVYWDAKRAFHGRQTAKEFLSGNIKKLLLQHRNDQILLIAHSMGSIIAYDALCELLIETPDFKIDTFITIGSPLGLPRVKRKALQYSSERWPLVPENAGKWYNFADRRDPVAVDTSLKRDYRARDGAIAIVDDLVINDYVFSNEAGEEKGNPHKSYGYLRCPEISKVINEFIED